MKHQVLITKVTGICTREMLDLLRECLSPQKLDCCSEGKILAPVGFWSQNTSVSWSCAAKWQPRQYRKVVPFENCHKKWNNGSISPQPWIQLLHYNFSFVNLKQ